MAMAFADKTRKEDWPIIIQTLHMQGYTFSESALRYVKMCLGENFPPRPLL